MRIEDLRKGDYVDLIFNNKSEKTRCMVVHISITNREAIIRELSNQSVFYVDSEEKWNFVKDIQMTESELRNLKFVYNLNKQVYMFPNSGAWEHPAGIIVTKYNGCYDLILKDNKAFYGCKSIHIPYVHLLQNAVKDNYGLELSYI